MERLKIETGIMVVLLLAAAAFVSHLPMVKASGTIYIMADGSVDPPTAPILNVDNIVYILTDDISEGIVVGRSNITVDGYGHTLQNPGTESRGFYISEVDNVTIQNTNIKYFDVSAIEFFFSYNNTIVGNNITNNYRGISFESSSGNNVTGNNIVAQEDCGINLVWASHNNIFGNNITENKEAGIRAHGSSGNLITENIIANNNLGVALELAVSNNIIYHNDFLENTLQASVYELTNIWDNGYPSGGNYWTDYTGTDANGDGIGDTPYVIDANNQDNYPLMNPWKVHDVAVVDVAPFKTIVGQETRTFITVTVKNQGGFTETFNVTAYYDQTAIMIEQWPNGENSQNFWSMGDVNRDGYVDYWDMYKIGQAFASTPEDPRWNPDADINSDGRVNAIDLSSCAKNFGKDIWTSLGLPKLIENQRAVTLSSRRSTTVTFIWNTTGVVIGNYTISAYAWPVTGETDTTDNTSIDGWVFIAGLGDINANGNVDIYDIVEVARAFGSPCYIRDSNYDPRADVNNDGIVDIFDVVTIAPLFGATYLYP